MAGEEGGAGRHTGTVDRVESGSGYGRGAYGRGFHGYDRGYGKGRGFDRHDGKDSWGSDGYHDRVGDGRELRGTNTSNSRGNASNSGGNASNSRGIASNSSGMASNSMGYASNSRGNASNSRGIASKSRSNASNTRGIASNSSGMASNSRGNASNTRGIPSNSRGIASNSRGIASNSRGNSRGIASNSSGMASNSMGYASNSRRNTINTRGIASNSRGNASNTRGIASNFSGMASNSTGYATNYRGIVSNSRGMTRSSRGSASNSYSYTRGSHSNYRDSGNNCGGEARNFISNASNSGSSTINSMESASHSRGSAEYGDSKSKCVTEAGEVDEDSIRMTSTMESFEYALPVEHWMQVLGNVPPKDLCNVALTSRHMNNIATTPELWTRMVVSKGMVKMRGLAQFFKVNRFKKIKQMDFSLMHLSKKEGVRLLNDIPGSPLQKVDFSYNNLRGVFVSAEALSKLSKAVAHLKMVNLERTRLTTSQLIIVLKAILSSKVLQDVNLASNDLHDIHKGKGIPIDLLCRAVCRLQKVNLAGTSLNAGQCARLVEAILLSESLLDVTLSGNSLSGVSANLLARAVCRLQRVDLAGTSLTAHQSTRILVASLSSSTLRDVTLACADLSKVSADLLARVVSLLHKIDLGWTKLTADQSTRVVDAIISSSSLVEVSLSGIDLSHVPADLLAKAVGSLKTVNLKCTKLTADQSSAVVEAIVSSNSLVEISLYGIDLSQVPADLLATAMGSLKTVDLTITGNKLTADQSAKVVDAIISSNSLVEVTLSGIDLSQVPADLLAKAVGSLKTVNLRWAKLTADQSSAVVEVISSSNSLVEVSLSSADLSQVPAHLLARAAGRLTSDNRDLTPF